MDYAGLLDDELMRRVEDQDLGAFDALYGRYGDLVYSVSLRVVGDTHVAQDVTQDVFLRVWRRPEQFDVSRGKFVTWLLSVARNRSIDERRSQGRRLRREALPPTTEEEEVLPSGNDRDDPAMAPALADERRAVRKAMEVLPPEQKLAIQLAYFGGLTQVEIAEKLGQPLGTVNTRIRLGMQKMRGALEERRGMDKQFSMTTDVHETTRENIDAWALGALDAEEARALETHIATCDACAAIADATRETASALGLAVPLVAAPIQLRAHVMASANVLREMPAPAAARRRSWWPQSAAAAVAIIGIGMMTWGTVMQRRVSNLSDCNDQLVVAATSQTNEVGTVHAEVSMASANNASLASQQDAMFDVVSQPDVVRVQLNGTSTMPAATGRYVWSNSTKTGVLVARDLPALDSGNKYCLWLVYENAWVAGGKFDVDATGTGRLVVHDVEDQSGAGAFRGFAVTVEPDASTAPTKHSGPTLMQANLN